MSHFACLLRVELKNFLHVDGNGGKHGVAGPAAARGADDGRQDGRGAEDGSPRDRLLPFSLYTGKGPFK